MANNGIGRFSSQPDLETLRDEHAALDARLNKLKSRRSVSPEEQYEMMVIKKRKLALKDQISRLAR